MTTKIKILNAIDDYGVCRHITAISVSYSCI